IKNPLFQKMKALPVSSLAEDEKCMEKLLVHLKHLGIPKTDREAGMSDIFPSPYPYLSYGRSVNSYTKTTKPATPAHLTAQSCGSDYTGLQYIPFPSKPVIHLLV